MVMIMFAVSYIVFLIVLIKHGKDDNDIKLIDACDSDYGNVVITKIEDLKKLQFGNEYNPRDDELIINFKEMTIMIYNYWIE